MTDLDTGDADELPATDLGKRRRGPAQDAADELPAMDLGERRRGPAQDAADESEATLRPQAGAVPAVPAAAADEHDLEEAVDVNAGYDLWRASESVADARYVIRTETETVDKSQSDLFMPLRSDTVLPAPLTRRKRKKK